MTGGISRPAWEARLQRFASLVELAIANADAWDQLAHQASSDPLTGIANRRVFDERLSVEAARARSYDRQLSLVVIDLDHFKTTNDRHGHAAGDRVLVLFAQLLSAHAREGELDARIGGEEFAWLMPETDPRDAYTATERIRGGLQDVPFDAVSTVTSPPAWPHRKRARRRDAPGPGRPRALPSQGQRTQPNRSPGRTSRRHAGQRPRVTLRVVAV
ncbi:MAG: GGDEF domain-containing protein [Solirubrobacteraceae bacterium]